MSAPLLAILTSGGDAPGMNMAVWAACERFGGECLGVREGFAGLLRGDFVRLGAEEVLPKTRLGGSFLGSSRDPDFRSKLPEAVEKLRAAGVTHLLVLGGNGSLQGAKALADAGVPTVGIPATIDNDVAGSEDSIGFDTAANSGLTLLDQFRDTAESLPRLCALETLGGPTGFLAQAVAQAGGADSLLVPERPVSADELEHLCRQAVARQNFALVVASEGYPELEGVLGELERRLALRLRFARPSHTMRGGRPTARDRLLARALAEAAADALTRGQTGAALWQSGGPVLTPFDRLASHKPFEL